MLISPAVAFYIPANDAQSFQFSTSSPALVIFPVLKKITAILMSVKWHLTVALICIYLMAIDAETHFLRLWAICMSFQEKRLIGSFAHF